MEIVSVIIPCYNQGCYIDECLESVINQTYKYIEIIIVDDGSTDKATIKKLKEIKNNNVKIIHIENSGVSNARNVGIQNSLGKYILPLDADDKIHSTYIEKSVDILKQNKSIDIVYCITQFFGEKNGLFVLNDFTVKEMLIHNLVICTAMFRKDDFYLAKGYNKNMILGYEDWDFWLSMVENNKKFYRINEVLFYYRIKKVSRNADLAKVKRKELSMIEQVYNNHKSLYEKYEFNPFNNIGNFSRVFRKINRECKYILQNIRLNYYKYKFNNK